MKLIANLIKIRKIYLSSVIIKTFIEKRLCFKRENKGKIY